MTVSSSSAFYIFMLLMITCKESVPVQHQRSHTNQPAVGSVPINLAAYQYSGRPLHQQPQPVPSQRMQAPPNLIDYPKPTESSPFIELAQQFGKEPTVVGAVGLLPEIQGVIGNHSPSNVTTYGISRLYTKILIALETNSEFNQKQLVFIIEMMIDQNDRLGINLDVSVWNTFFMIYYKLPSQFESSYIFDLLNMCCKKTGGIGKGPNIETFWIILSGIVSRKDLLSKDKYLLFHSIKSIYRIPIHSMFYQQLFEQSSIERDFETIRKLLFDHPDIRFHDANIHIFNEILKSLPNFAEQQSSDLGHILLHFMNVIVKNHGVVYTDYTYKILGEYICDKLGNSTKQIFHHIHQPHPRHSCNIYGILQKLKQIEKVKTDVAYQNYLKYGRPLFKDKADIKPPDPFQIMLEADWNQQIHEWREKLNVLDNMIFSRLPSSGVVKDE